MPLFPDRIPTLEYHREKREYIECARSGEADIIAIAEARVGDPLFDALPEILDIAPLGISLRFILIRCADFSFNEQSQIAAEGLLRASLNRAETKIYMKDEWEIPGNYYPYPSPN